MKKIFIDTNILVDLIADRKPFSKYAIEIFNLAENKKIRLYTSSHSIATTYYLLKKFIDDKSLRGILLSLFEFVTVIPVDEQVLSKGLRAKQKDFEDAIQVYCAITVEKIDCIVTRNIKDFKGVEIPVLAPDELFSKI
ncbi:MAG: PIN domain-containing protein [Sediminibacterium sp.]|jgi:predicted nucleic acid-binding protein|uniref:type II toxin-antitoxin system VapC family toxin n=1 Tax=Sediminibacterium sp. TaxID=1917865 RepID=UPI002AB8F209|nr:PIN domain-containing protein [Sediminibacterium sp.]MDZ4072901.1 PIN domain-containing protein [Sediminibacterium sp.]